MYTKILFLAIFTALISSCSSTYKTGQTPDDVYFSPERPQTDNYVQVKNNNRRYYSADEYYEDRLIRMKVGDRNRWAEVDDWYYYNNSYNNYSYSRNWNNPWNAYTYWNYAYNPYCPNPYIITTYNPKTDLVVNTPRVFNLNGFTNTEKNNGNSKVPGVNTNNWYYNSNNNNNTYTQPQYRNSNNSSRDNGNFLRDVFNTMGNSKTNNSNMNTNGSSNTNSSSSGNSSSGTTAPVRKFDN